MTEEQWAPINGYEGRYEVSDQGQVRTLLQTPPRMLRQSLVNTYRVVNLHKDGKARQVMVHSLVAEAFIGRRPLGAVIRHRNGDRDDNSHGNLRYGTHVDNVKDAIAHGTMRRSLSDFQVAIVKGALSVPGVVSQKTIAEILGVSPGIVHRAAHGKGLARYVRGLPHKTAIRLLNTM